MTDAGPKRAVCSRGVHAVRSDPVQSSESSRVVPSAMNTPATNFDLTLRRTQLPRGVLRHSGVRCSIGQIGSWCDPARDLTRGKMTPAAQGSQLPVIHGPAPRLAGAVRPPRATTQQTGPPIRAGAFAWGREAEYIPAAGTSPRRAKSARRGYPVGAEE